MNKSKKKINNYNPDVLEALENMYGFSVDYIRKCLRGDRTGVMPDQIRLSYKELDNASKKGIQKVVNNTK